MSHFLSAKTARYFHAPEFKWTKTFRQPGGEGSRTFTILIASALDAGIIGFEYNGIAVLDEDQKALVVDSVKRETSGYFGPSQSQIFFAESLRMAEWGQFVGALIRCPGYLDCLETGPIEWFKDGAKLPTVRPDLSTQATSTRRWGYR